MNSRYICLHILLFNTLGLPLPLLVSPSLPSVSTSSDLLLDSSELESSPCRMNDNYVIKSWLANLVVNMLPSLSTLSTQPSLPCSPFSALELAVRLDSPVSGVEV